MEAPSGIDPMRACGNEKLADVSAKTRSKSGNIVTQMPEVKPFKPQTRSFGKAASEIRKFLERNFNENAACKENQKLNSLEGCH